jgi:salicylate hydroxylase
LQQVLYEAAIKRGITLRLGCLVVALDEDDQTLAVVVKGGERIEADVIVGADGKSTTNPPRATQIRF